MQLPDTALRTAVFALLQAATLPGGAKVYDSLAPDTATGRYLILGPQRNAPEGDKSAFGFAHRLMLSAVYKAGSAVGGRLPAEELLNAALAALTPQKPGQDEPVQPEGWACWLTEVETPVEVILTTASGTTYQKIATIVFHLETT